MNEYDKQYYFIRRASNDNLPELTPDANTEDRTFRYERQQVGSPPLVFNNGGEEYAKKLGIPALKMVPDILFEGSNLVVCSRIREALLEHNIPNMHMHPTVYVHDDKKRHDDYWYVTFTEKLDCWNKLNSIYDEEPLEIGGFRLYSVLTYSLNTDKLDRIPLGQRLLFKMGSTLDGFIVCHESMIDIFLSGTGRDGAMLQPIYEY